MYSALFCARFKVPPPPVLPSVIQSRVTIRWTCTQGPAFHATSILEPIVAPAPALGEHPREICRTILRMADADVSKLVAEGVLEESASKRG